MTDDEENAIVNAHAEAMMKSLTAGGKPVEAVVTVVLFRGGQSFHIGSLIDSEPRSEEEANTQEGSVLMAASDLIEVYVHERGICTECEAKKEYVH